MFLQKLKWDLPYDSLVSLMLADTNYLTKGISIRNKSSWVAAWRCNPWCREGTTLGANSQWSHACTARKSKESWWYSARFLLCVVHQPLKWWSYLGDHSVDKTLWPNTPSGRNWFGFFLFGFYCCLFGFFFCFCFYLVLLLLLLLLFCFGLYFQVHYFEKSVMV